jgi:hypothetical protein
MNISNQKKSRRSMLLLLAAFIAPIILAKLALMQNWFDYGVTNQGTLVDNELTLTQLGLGDIDFNHQWVMLYALPKVCDQHCERTLYSVHNTYKALGRETPRVTPLALTYQALSPVQQQMIQDKQWQVMSIPNQAKSIIPDSQVLIVDPLGNVVLSHLPPQQQEGLAAFGKAILADFKKLLKYSRVG